METIVMRCSALPDSEWRVLRSAVNYALAHEGHEPSEYAMAVFPNGLPEIDEWDELVHAVTLLRSAAAEAAIKGRPMTRREYMRIYMQRRRAKQVE